jgi:hypothetical protein
MISKRIDQWVEWTKWPAAVLAMVSTPLTVYAWSRLLYRSLDFPGYLIAFGLGIAAFVLVVRSPWSRSTFVRRLVELERDITQSILATLMLHPVVGFGTHETNKGSRVRWLGKGNWVMLVAPYVIPTATILLWLLSLMFFQTLRSVLLGFGISYHLVTVYLQWQSGTSELRRLGKRFCRMFLPAVNLFVAGCAMAFALNGFSGMSDFLYDAVRVPSIVYEYLASFMHASTPNEPSTETPSP